MVNIAIDLIKANIRLKAEIITIGDEILIGQIVDSNSAWIGQTLNKEGIDVLAIQSISDHPQDIKAAVDLAFSRADLILMTGGLGPTQDDLTKATLTEYFDSTLVLNQEVLDHLVRIFDKFGRSLLDMNKEQAMVPDNCEVLFNAVGTAPGMLFKKGNKWLASMPGVPYEMKQIIEEQLLPQVKTHFKLDKIEHQTITTIGVPESLLARKLAGLIEELPKHIKPAYLPNLNLVRFRLSARGGYEITEELKVQMAKVVSFLGKDVVLSEKDQSPSACIYDLLKERNLKITMAESCTGGYVAHQLTMLPGASAVFKGSLVAYDYDVKTTELGVPEHILLETGAVSQETVEFMCAKVRDKYKSDIGIGISGIAGPGGGTEDKPVGTVFVGVSNGTETWVKRYHFHGDRLKIIQRTSNVAYDMARKLILGLN